jgi:DNA-binding response OmpR family regulator
MTVPVRRILIAEDEVMISMMVEDFLEQLGYGVAAVCMTGAQCESLFDSGEPFDAALLDCNLSDGPVWPVARRLRTLGVPFIFASGDGGHGRPADLADVPVLGKPYLIEALERSLAELFDR